MFTKTLVIAALSFLALTAAQAQEVTPEPLHVYSSTLTRAEVRQAALDPLHSAAHHGGDRTVIAEPTGPSKSRAQVVAETLEAVRLGVVDRGEASTVITSAQLESIRMAGLKAVPMNMAMR